MTLITSGAQITPMQRQVVMDEEILTFVGLLSCNEEDGNFIDDDAWVMEREDITGERDAFDVFVDDDEVF